VLQLLWLLDRPESADAAALDDCDHVFAASARAAELFAPLTQTPVSALPPAADDAAAADGKRARRGILVVGDADPRIAAHACAAEASFYGESWQRHVPAHNWRGALPDDPAARARLYAAAAVVVVAAGETGRRFGHVPQPALDAAACGARIVMQDMPGIGALLGESVRAFRDDASFRAAVAAWRDESRAARARRLDHARILRLRHCYAERAAEIADVARKFLALHLR
ncbi:MAG: hypothetical protein IT538_10135, partial [Variibacter sp.]|nr:hypothetical protein [Variibacter sp.]